jgi:hypothetical protein
MIILLHHCHLRLSGGKHFLSLVALFPSFLLSFCSTHINPLVPDGQRF